MNGQSSLFDAESRPAPPQLLLRDYQREALDAIAAAESRGVRRQLVALPTGSGKTVIFSHALAERRSRGQCVVLVHRDELARQAIEKLQAVNGRGSVGLVKADVNETGADLIVASVQTLARDRRRAAFCEAVPNVSTIVVDEGHHAVADTYWTVLSDLGAFEPGGPLTLGFTATPERADGKALGDLWQEVVYQRSIMEMIAAKYLCDITGIHVRLEGLDLARVPRSAGDYQDGALGEALEAANAPEHAVAAYREHAEGRKALLFTPTVRLARQMAAEFATAGIPAGWVSGEMPLEERRDVLARFGAGALRVVSNAMVLTEGYDEPSVDCVILARPTRSHALFVQQVGRGTRPYLGKTGLLVLDLVGASEDNKLITVVDLLGREAGISSMRDGQSLLQALAEAEDDERSRLGGRLRAQVVDLFGRSGLRWLSFGTDRWVLPLERGSILLAPDAAGNWVARVETGREAAVQTLFAGPDVGYAQGAAEDFARRQTSARLVERTAAWRETPASEKQRELLGRYRVATPPELTKGEAADHLSLIFARRAWGAPR